MLITLLASDALPVADLERRVASARVGAVVAFHGTARTVSSLRPGATVVRLEYEVYAEMAGRLLDAIARDTAARFSLEGIALAHRSGIVLPGEPALFCACAALHRAEAFEACRHAVERVKHELPVWKRELFADGTSAAAEGA